MPFSNHNLHIIGKDEMDHILSIYKRVTTINNMFYSQAKSNSVD